MTLINIAYLPTYYQTSGDEKVFNGSGARSHFAVWMCTVN